MKAFSLERRYKVEERILLAKEMFYGILRFKLPWSGQENKKKYSEENNFSETLNFVVFLSLSTPVAVAWSKQQWTLQEKFL